MPAGTYNVVPWNLRGFRKHQQRKNADNSDAIRTARANLTSTGSGSGSETAEAIFCSYCNLNDKDGTSATRRKGVIDGSEVIFELREKINDIPKTSRHERQNQIQSECRNVKRSSWDLRCKWWLLQYGVPQLTLMYTVLFLGMNFLFAMLWYFVDDDNKCCDDPYHTYFEIFDFAIQTSTTIGYGGYVPTGRYSNFLVVVISILSLVLNSVYAGLLFLKFIAPTSRVLFSDYITLSNVNGIPTLELRVGNADSYSNLLIDVHVRLSYTYRINYKDEKGLDRTLSQTQELNLLSDKRYDLGPFVWVLRHLVDETSPLFGVDFTSFPGSQISGFRVSLQATQKSTGSVIFHHAGYGLQDVLLGYRFLDQVEVDNIDDVRSVVTDYSKLSMTEPQPVWYPIPEAP